MKPSTGSVTIAPIAAPRPMRRGLEEARARVRRQRLRAAAAVERSRCGLVGDGARLRLDRGHLVAHVARDVARPEEAEDDGDDRADRGDDPADDEAEQETRHPDGEADRPEARARVRAGCRGWYRSKRALRWIQSPCGPACQRRAVCRDARILHFAEDACHDNASSPYSAQRRVTRSRISSDMTISSGHGRASSSGSLCVASIPSLPP